MSIDLKKALFGSLILHIILFALIWLTEAFKHKNELRIDKPVAITVSMVKPMKMPPPPVTEAKLEKPTPPAPEVVKPKALVKPIVKVKKPLVRHIYKKPTPKPAALPIKNVPLPQEKPRPIAKPTPRPVKTGPSEAELAAKYASLISSCIKTKMNLVALGEEQNFDILVHFYLTRQRDLAATPDIKVEGGDERQKNIAVNQTMLALKACTPFNLPVDKYDIWKEVNMKFSPN